MSVATRARDIAPREAGGRTQTTAVARPVFLHTGWRTAGTWLWSRFRECSRVIGFYEPLHEGLARLSLDQLPLFEPRGWASGHPTLTRPYFDEFAPLLRHGQGGIKGYMPEFATQDFFAAPNAHLPKLQTYLESLLQHAASRHEQAVLKFCRSIGRTGWMQRRFPAAAHVVVLRNPASQFGSALRQYRRHDNPYFLILPLILLEQNQSNAHVLAAIEQFAVQVPSLPVPGSGPRTMSAYLAYLRRTTPDDWYRGFLAFWTSNVVAIPTTVDCVLDTDLLSSSCSYREACRNDLAMLTGLPLDLGNYRPSEDNADVFGVPRTKASHLHDRARAFLAKRSGPAWADSPLGARIGALLACADLIAMDGHAALAARTLSNIAVRDRLRKRVARTEIVLNRVRTSRSWRMTVAFRRMIERWNRRPGQRTKDARE
jgi:hypothetical protein